nr:ATP-binding protein [Eubacterium sp.]
MSMFVGRKNELAALKENFQKSGIPVVVLYGREGIGKTTLIREFAKETACVYYLGRELSKQEQLMSLDVTMKEVDDRVEKGEKLCLVLDEFDLMHKGYKDFFGEFGERLEKSAWNEHVMIVLASSSVQWIENQMVDEMGAFAARISSFMKLKEFTFLEMVNRFPESSTEECITIYSILGGVPGYLDYWDPKKTVRENVISLILERNGAFRKEANRFLKTGLRELPFYNTILTVLAEDEPRLNYLYNRTGFSRAKISVYIKNLIQMDVAEKYFSYEPKKKDCVLKGLYGISDSFMHFWYKFVFPNQSQLEFTDASTFYDTYIKEELSEYVCQTFEKVCKEFLALMNQYGKLGAHYDLPVTFYGRDGRIPIVAESENGKLLVGTCKWSVEPMNRDEFTRFVQTTEQIGQEADHYYLFSKEGFTNELSIMAKGMDNIELIDLDSL